MEHLNCIPKSDAVQIYMGFCVETLTFVVRDLRLGIRRPPVWVSLPGMALSPRVLVGSDRPCRDHQFVANFHDIFDAVDALFAHL
jgi:hypothetical protein